MNTWQTVDTAPVNTWILATCGNGYLPDVAKLNTSRDTWEFTCDKPIDVDDWPVTHWMHLPPPPDGVPTRNE